MSQSLLQILSMKYARSGSVIICTLASFLFLYELLKPQAQTSVSTHGRTWKPASQTQQDHLNDIRNSTLGFEKILAINMPERADHRDGLVLAGALSEIDIEFVAGVHPDTISTKTFPANYKPEYEPPGWLGGWRAHIDALSRVVKENWSSTLILEDDVDWDIRLKSLLQEFAGASDYVLRTSNTDAVLYDNIVSGEAPKTSPYGDNWDVLWLGHCGAALNNNKPVVLRMGDPSVAEDQWFASWNLEHPLNNYPNHTRAVSAVHQNTCSLAYAVSQAGARKLLYSLGLERLDFAFDIMLREWCEGTHGHQMHTCISVLPPLIEHHRRPGPTDADSDIVTGDGGVRETAFTLNLRWSVRMNIEKLLQGETDYQDQFPDTVL